MSRDLRMQQYNTDVYGRQMDIVARIINERYSQDRKWGWPYATETADELATHLAGANKHAKVSILTEEVGEVAKAVLEEDWANLKVELVQVAAVALAWLESIEEFGR